MKTAVRYFSRSGNTKVLAEAIAQGAQTSAMSVDQPGCDLTEKTEVLFIGGALYAYGIDERLKTYIDDINPAYVGKAVLFSTSWVSKHALELMRKRLMDKGIQVDDDVCYVRGKPNSKNCQKAAAFAKVM